MAQRFGQVTHRIPSCPGQRTGGRSGVTARVFSWIQSGRWYNQFIYGSFVWTLVESVSNAWGAHGTMDTLEGWLTERHRIIRHGERRRKYRPARDCGRTSWMNSRTLVGRT